MKIIENGNEVIVRQYEISVNVCEFQKVKAGRIDRLTLRIEDNGGEMNLFKRVFYEETSGYGVLCIRCFHTLETIYFMARGLPADAVYRDTCKVGGPQKEVVFYTVYAVPIELLRVCESVDVFNGLCEALDGIHSTRPYRRSLMAEEVQDQKQIEASLYIQFTSDTGIIAENTAMRICRVYGEIFQAGNRGQFPPVCRFQINLARKYTVPRSHGSDIGVLLYMVIDKPDAYNLPAVPMQLAHYVRTFSDDMEDVDTLYTAEIEVKLRTTLVIPVYQEASGLNFGYVPCRSIGDMKQGFIMTPLRENPETKHSFRRMKDGEVCGVCNNLYRILELLHEKDDENCMKRGNNGKN